MPDLVEGLSPQDPKIKLMYADGGPGEGAAYREVSPLLLVVDDDDDCRQVLLDYLQMTGLPCLGAANAYQALEVLRCKRIDLVISDIKMAGKDGVALMQEAHRKQADIPFIIMTGYAPEYSYEEIINAGASDFIAKPFSLGELKAKICRIQREQDILRQLQLTLKRVKRLFEDLVGALASTLEKRDPYTAGHQNRVGELACAIGREMGLREDRIEVLRLAAFVHDIGKVGVPTDILTKPGKLSETEMNLIRVHCQVGFDILKNVDFPWPIAEMVFQHHERFNGSGYPQGLMGAEILLEARILGVADVVEAMSAHRPYRPALGVAQALAEIAAHRGTLYDAQVVDACVNLITNHGFKFNS